MQEKVTLKIHCFFEQCLEGTKQGYRIDEVSTLTRNSNGWPSIGRKKNVEKTTAKNVERRNVESRNVEERDAERINVERNILKLEMSENRLIS